MLNEDNLPGLIVGSVLAVVVTVSAHRAKKRLMSLDIAFRKQFNSK